MSVWPSLPAPGELVRLPLPCPPQLIELVGYDAGGRLVALWWADRELMFSDGTVTSIGSWRGCLFFCQHPLGRVFLDPYRLGACEREAEHRLLVDRHLGTLDVGLARDVEQLLATQPSELAALTADLSAGETQALVQHALDVAGERQRAKTADQLQVELRAAWQREQELLEQLSALLDRAQRAVCDALWPRPGPHPRERRAVELDEDLELVASEPETLVAWMGSRAGAEAWRGATRRARARPAGDSGRS